MFYINVNKMNVNLSDFKIIPLLDSIKRVDMDDETYFSEKYRSYISNSRLKYISPKDGGSPDQYQNPPHFSTQSLKLGSAIHECLLQPDAFTLAPKMGRPTAKLGEVLERTYNYVKDGMEREDAIRRACKEVEYYVNQIDKKIPMIIEKGTPYWEALDTPRWVKEGIQEIFLSDADYDIVEGCLQSCFNNLEIMNKLHPIDSFGDEVESYNEIAFFIEFAVEYKGKLLPNKLKFKMKADNYTVDTIAKQIVLNDVKTTSKPLAWFMNSEYGSLVKYSYHQQLALYLWILELYCLKFYGASKETGWTSQANFLVVQTFGTFDSKCYNLSDRWLAKGLTRGKNLLKMVAAYENFGWKTKIDFE